MAAKHKSGARFSMWIIKGKGMRNKKTSGTETLITVVIAVLFVLSMSWLFSDGPSRGASEHQHQDEPW